MKKSIKAMLVVSILLNLLFAGLILGHMGKSFLRGGKTPYQEMVAKLPADKQKIYKDAVAHAEQDNAELHEQFDDIRKKSAAILKAPDFDRESYIKQITKLHELRGKIMYNTANAVADIAGKFSPDERATLADIFRKSGSSWRVRKCEEKSNESAEIKQ